nr:rho GTPase-activating protein 11A-like [Leptinotarsa decemlineata]
MFMNDVHKKEEIRNLAVKHLRKYGIKHRAKSCRQSVQVVKSKKLFNVPLANLENETVTLKNGQQLVVPKRLYEMCSYILSKVDTEGLFRKEGSRSRQNIIKLSLDRGCMLGYEHHVIDVAVILKCFLRELPEPLIPYSFHELFLRCSLIENKVEAILLASLLIPMEHLNVLSYLMQFFSEVASHSKHNKMNSFNISILVGPNVFPVNEKVAPKNKLMVKKTCDIVKLMIDNSNNIGVIPDFILEQIGNLRVGELDIPDKVKRRSGSLTRIFNGLKKIVGNRTDEHTVDSK